MNLKSKSKVFKTWIEKIDLVLSEADNFETASNKLKSLTLKVRGEYIQPMHTDLGHAMAMDEFENR